MNWRTGCWVGLAPLLLMSACGPDAGEGLAMVFAFDSKALNDEIVSYKIWVFIDDKSDAFTCSLFLGPGAVSPRDRSKELTEDKKKIRLLYTPTSFDPIIRSETTVSMTPQINGRAKLIPLGLWLFVIEGIDAKEELIARACADRIDVVEVGTKILVPIVFENI